MKRSAFTLVEILTVIVIISILAAISVPAVTAVVRKANNTAIKVEMDVMGTGLETYKQSYGDYPPDFSDWRKVESHFRKAFPQIADEELKILAQFCYLDNNFERVPPVLSAADPSADPRSGNGYAYYRQCIDPAEALVFCLGGFSSDAQRPFTGTGGPLVLISPAPPAAVPRAYNHYQYNINRDNFKAEFDAEGLSIFVANNPDSKVEGDPLATGTFYTYSSDEFFRGMPTPIDIQSTYSTRADGSPFAVVRYLCDPFPVYVKGSDSNPLVYFNSDTYQQTFTPASVTGGWSASAPLFHNLNYFAAPSGDAENGVARPYLSDQIDTVAGGYRWEGSNKYQIISAGLDNSFGGSIANGIVDPNDATTFSFAGNVTIFPTGKFANGARQLVNTGDKYEDPQSIYNLEKPQLDNIATFSRLVFEDELP